jgi:glucose 1-dehydrogenase
MDGKNVLVTAASSGIGRAIAIRFAQEGANVAINFRSGAEHAETTRRMVRDAYVANGRAERLDLVVQADISHEDQVKAMFGRVLSEFGRLDVLINNAGTQKAAASHEIEMADFDRVLSVNVRSPFLCAREAIRHFSFAAGRRCDSEQLQHS